MIINKKMNNKLYYHFLKYTNNIKMLVTKTQCLKIAELRKIGIPNLEEWMKDDNNIYVGRAGRIFITDMNGTKRIFHYPSSKWYNPFKLSEYTLVLFAK